jgi:hypothetical protein
MREAIARANAAKVSLFERRVLEAVLWLTASYSRVSDDTSVRQIASIVYGVARDDVNRRQRDRVGEVLERLHKAGVITYEPGRGRYSRCRVGLPQCTPDSRGIGESGQDPESVTGDTSSRSMHPDSGRSMHPNSGASMPPTGGATPRSTTEKKNYREENARSLCSRLLNEEELERAEPRDAFTAGGAREGRDEEEENRGESARARPTCERCGHRSVSSFISGKWLCISCAEDEGLADRFCDCGELATECFEGTWLCREHAEDERSWR